MPTPRDNARKRKTASYIGAKVILQPAPEPVPEPEPDPEEGEGEGA